MSADLACIVSFHNSFSAQHPELYHSLVGATQSTVFAQDLLGDAFHTIDLKKTKRSKGKEPARRRPRKKQTETVEYWWLMLLIGRETSLVTSFTDALPFISSKATLSPPSDSLALPTLEISMPQDFSGAALKRSASKTPGVKRQKKDVLSPPLNSTGPTFGSYLNWMNSNGWMDPERTLNDTSLPFGSFSPFIQGSSKIGFDGASRAGALSPPPRFDTLLGKDEKEEMSRASNLYNRMVTTSNSISFGASLPPLTAVKNKYATLEGNGEFFQKDSYLCFPCSFDNSA